MIVLIFFIILGCILFLIYFKKSKKRTSRKVLDLLKNQSVEISPGVRTCVLVENIDLVKQHFKDVSTVYKAFYKGVKTSRNLPFFGELKNGVYLWTSYIEAFNLCQRFGSALVQKGLKIADSSNTVGIYCKNCIEWNIVAEACSMYSLVLVPLYDTLDFDVVRRIISSTDMVAFVCYNWTQALNMLERHQSTLTLRLVVIVSDQDCFDADYRMSHWVSETKEKKINIYSQVHTKSSLVLSLAKECNVEVLSYQEMLQIGLRKMIDVAPPAPNFPHSIMHTPASTGKHKAVLLTHGAIIASISGLFFKDFQKKIIPNSDDVHLSHLSSAGIYERNIQIMMMLVGGRIGFSSGDIDNLLEEIAILKPTFLATVPRVLNNIYNHVQLDLLEKPWKKLIFDYAMKRKLPHIKKNLLQDNPFWDSLVFHPIQRMMGGRLRVCISSTSPLSQRVMNFARSSFGCHVYEAYELTEFGGTVAITMPFESQCDIVGAPLPHCSFKLVNHSDNLDLSLLGYTGAGEIYIKGTSCMQNYHNDPDLTKLALDNSGFLRTGDIGHWMPDGTLKVIDRCANILLLHEEAIVCLQVVENVYLASLFISQIFVDRVTADNFLLAVVVPNFKYLVNDGIYEEFLQGTEERPLLLKKKLLRDMDKVAREANLKVHEMVTDIHIHSEGFTVAGGLLTPSLNNNRSKLRRKFQEEFDTLSQERSSKTVF